MLYPNVLNGALLILLICLLILIILDKDIIVDKIEKI